MQMTRSRALQGSSWAGTTACIAPTNKRHTGPTNEEVEVSNQRVLAHQRGGQAQLAVRLQAATPLEKGSGQKPRLCTLSRKWADAVGSCCRNTASWGRTGDVQHSATTRCCARCGAHPCTSSKRAAGLQAARTPP